MTDVSDFPLDDPTHGINGEPVAGHSLPNSTGPIMVGPPSQGSGTTAVPTVPGAADGYGGSAPAPLTGVVNPPDEPTRVKILKEAAGLITGDRQEEYGTPQVNFQRIATMFQVLFPEREWTPADIAIAMLSLKLARGVQGYKRDTAVDAAGYAALWAELSEG